MKNEYAVFYVSLKVLLKKGDEFLFLKGVDSFFDWPGGRIDEGEQNVSFQKIIDREIKEELGEEVRYELGDQVFYSRRYLKSKRKYVFSIIHEGKYLSGKIELSPEHSSYEWINPKTYTFKKSGFINNEEYLAFKKYFELIKKSK
ncbi:MAG: hypothetical protein COX90_01655 [Candidatus Nealsonbacteria bacterium CG_4_10_14_0_2_um_filter_38_17]|uniref:Uncharacterized protein n=2 Tax=Candidatus Nealsoniibacteriota TaxID=1817911 RepID=A0A2M7UYM0_9BACT|nr:MAG: hypothetical protein COX36_03505 [Candidatus Nealsonbacteria bacterium CG23_combo_of_CG06-09_8_20_14_all_38_19]PIZ89008.1 MAG: hypothetical protein COX90_01655 [Candidatus Nealsonbacteria bacterium CG_4_10_14_0_2_um_filter_38_17]